MKQEVITLGGVLHMLLRRKRLVIVSGLVGGCLAFAVGRTLPLHYASEGNVILQNAANAPDGAGAPAGAGVSAQLNVLQAEGLIRRSVAALPSTAGLVSTPRLPSQVIASLNEIREQLSRLWGAVDDRPETQTEFDKLVTYVKKHLVVEAKDNSNVIAVRFSAGTPQAAATMVNTIMQTYVATTSANQVAQTEKIDKWIAEQTEQKRRDVEAAEQRVTSFTQHHELAEVQGSLTSAIQLSKDQAQLSLAREEFARQQAALDTASRNGGADSPETLSSKSIQALKELESKTLEKMDEYTSYDPRRATLQRTLSGVRSQIEKETALVIASLARNVAITQAHVRALEATVQRESDAAQTSNVAGSTLKQLTVDLQAKQQLYVAFTTQAGQTRIAQEQAPSARVLFAAVPPPEPAQSYGLTSLLFGIFGGMAAAACSVVARSAFGTTIYSTYDMAIATGLPVLGGLPDLKKPFGAKKLDAEAAPVVQETFRAMSLTLDSSSCDGTTILFTSSESNEGKTTIATAFARRLAQDGYRVLLIDSDLRRPNLERTLGLRPAAYLESVLNGTASLEQAVIVDPTSHMNCLIANGSVRNPTSALGSENFRLMLAASRLEYDFVVLDGTPVLHVADSVLLAGLCDRVVFVVQAARMSRDLVSEATSRFPKRHREKMYALLTRARPDSLDRRDYYGGYTALSDLRS